MMSIVVLESMSRHGLEAAAVMLIDSESRPYIMSSQDPAVRSAAATGTDRRPGNPPAATHGNGVRAGQLLLRSPSMSVYTLGRWHRWVAGPIPAPAFAHGTALLSIRTDSCSASGSSWPITLVARICLRFSCPLR